MLTDKQLDRMSFRMYVIYVKRTMLDGRNIFVPHTDIRGHAIAYPSKASAATDLYNLRTYTGKRRVTLLKVGRIS
jgi:hypothetical protein